MGHEGRLAKFIGRLTGKDRAKKIIADTEIRHADFSQTYRFNAERFNLAITRLEAMRLSDRARAEIRTAIRTARAVQKDEDGTFWRTAMLESGIPLDKVNEISDRKDKLELADETAFDGDDEPSEEPDLPLS